MGAEEVLIPLGGMLMIVIIVYLIVYVTVQRAKLRASGGGDYQRLAEEAVRAQRTMLEETKRMNETLKEIERLLREV
jgi:hypothetical protein